MKRGIALILVLLLTASCALAEVEMLAVSVGKGDAILLRADDTVCLIDTGKKNAQANIEAALERMGVQRLDAVFITHTDNDHIGGLKWLRKSGMEIGAIYASKYFPESTEKKHPAVKTAKKLDLEVSWLAAGDAVALGDSGAVLRVLAPISEIPENEDDNSLVMLLDSPDGRILLAGDMEQAEEEALLDSGADLACDVLKVPNHGDDDACSSALIAACAPKFAVISTDAEEKPGTPSARIINDLTNALCETFITQDCALGVDVVMNGGEIRVSILDE